MSAMQAVIPANAGIPGQARDDVSWGFVIPADARISGVRRVEIPGQARDDVSWGFVISAYAGISGQARDDGKVDR